MFALFYAGNIFGKFNFAFPEQSLATGLGWRSSGGTLLQVCSGIATLCHQDFSV